jgi:hypothetical protein
VALPSLTVRGAGRQAGVVVMNASFAPSSIALAFAPTYDLGAFSPLMPELDVAPPRGTFVDGLVAALASTFALDESEQELATLLLFGRSIGAAARRMRIDNGEAQRRCRGLFGRTGADGHQQLFELALRLAAMTELSKYLLTANARRPFDRRRSKSGARV